MLKNLTRLGSKYHSVKNMEQYNKLVASLKTPYVLDFFADWCGPCKMLWPIISKVQADNGGKWTIVKIDIDQEALFDLVDKHQIQGVPTLAFYKGTEKLHQRAGFVNQVQFKELEKKYLL